MAGNQNDAYQIKNSLKKVFTDLKRRGLVYRDALFNADMSFDSRAARKILWNHGVKPNIPENRRNRKSPKRGRKRYFQVDVYKNRYVVERTFAWVDKFRTLLIRFERKDVYWLAWHFLAFTLINLRNLLAKV
jgi:transposase